MNGYNFTERVRRVLAMAREESAALGHEYVGTEHLLLALIREGESVGAAVLQNLGIDLDAVAQRVRDEVRPGKPLRMVGPDLPYTSRAKKVLELTMVEAHDLRHEYVGCEHLLLGLIREEKGVAAQVLAHAGARVDNVRAETLRILGPLPAPQPSGPRPEVRSTITSIRIELTTAGGRTTRTDFDEPLAAIAFLAREAGGSTPPT